MRLSKIFWGGVALAALSLGFISCGESEDDDGAIDGETISYTNSDTSNIYRSFKSTKTKHYSANALITINNATTKATESNNANAAYGFLFGLTETTNTVNSDNSTTYYEDEACTKKAKFYTFGIATVRWNAEQSKAQWYVSWCKNLPSTNFELNNYSGFEGTVYYKNNNTATSKKFETSDVETKIIPTTSEPYADVTSLSLSSNALIAQIRLTANDDGSYTVNLYSNATATDALATASIPAATTGLSKKTQLYLGRYVTVYSGETANGRIDYSDISGNPIPADYNED